jgi:thiol:disulfide interchange protein DsbC
MGGIMKLTKAILRFITTSAVAVAFVSSASAENVASKREISAKLQSLVPFVVIDVAEHQTGLYEIVTDKGLFYSTKDGEYLVSGSIHEFKTGLPNLTEMKKQQVAKTMIDTLRPTFVTYKAPQEKYEILAFFDTSCGFCRKMHSEISRYSAMGITVHYALFPRNGLQSPSANELANVACSSNPQMALNTVMQGGAIQATSCDSPVSKHFDLGQWLGVAGTPMLFKMNGAHLREGYAPAPVILNDLQSSN